MPRKRNVKQRKDPEVIFSAIDLMNTDINKMSEVKFRIMVIHLLAGS